MSIQTKLNIQFNKKQKRHATAIRWLINDNAKNRQTGRSMLLDALFIEKALKNRGKEFRIIDHYSIGQGTVAAMNSYTQRRIEKLLANAGITNYKLYHHSTHLLTLTIF